MLVVRSFVNRSSYLYARGSIGGGDAKGPDKPNLPCPKCGENLKNVDSLAPLTRFVKCDKCTHLFLVTSDSEQQKPIKAENLNKQQQAPQPKKMNPPPSPKRIYEFLNKFIIGQDHAKKVMSVAVYNHYKRIYNNISLQKSSSKEDSANE